MHSAVKVAPLIAIIEVAISTSIAATGFSSIQDTCEAHQRRCISVEWTRNGISAHTKMRTNRGRWDDDAPVLQNKVYLYITEAEPQSDEGSPSTHHTSHLTPLPYEIRQP